MNTQTKATLEDDLRTRHGLVTAAITIAAPDDVEKAGLVRALLERAIEEQDGDASKMIVSIHAHAYLEHAEVSESHNPIAVATAPLKAHGASYEAPASSIPIAG